MSILHVNHIQADCKKRFESLIDMKDIPVNMVGEDRETKFLSRAVAAFAIASLAKVDDPTAAAAVVDESSDHGIDGFFFDRNQHVAYLLQSKWVKTGSSSVDLASVLKFKAGIDDFFANNLSSFGPKMQAKSADIHEALDDSQTKFVFVVAYTGKPDLAPEVLSPLESLISELNEDSEMVSLRILNQKRLWDVVAAGALGQSVEMTVMLKEFGQVAAPYKAYYGQVDLNDIGSWARFGDRLYHQNIRNFKGSTDVNEAIIQTIKNASQNFLYFNNGITLLCGQLNKKPIGGASTESGVFECKDTSVINGAQTVGSIIKALAEPGVSGSSARVLVRLISLENCPPDFVLQVTEATNTQNRVEKKDFAALDSEQQRLKTDLWLSFKKDYVYRTGDPPPLPENGCTLDEATVALACANQDITYSMDAKRAVGKLYDDIRKPPYVVLFNAGLSAIKLWRCVEVLRLVDDRLKPEQSKKEGKQRLVAIHGNRVLLYLVFQSLLPDVFDQDEERANKEKGRIPGLCERYLSGITDEIAKSYATSYPGNIFKSTRKCKFLVSAMGNLQAASTPEATAGLEPAGA